MSDGSSGETVRNADFWHNRLKLCEDIVIKNMASISSVIQDQLSQKALTKNKIYFTI